MITFIIQAPLSAVHYYGQGASEESSNVAPEYEQVGYATMDLRR